MTLLRGALLGALLPLVALNCLWAEGPWEVTPQSQKALADGLENLAKTQGREGNWNARDLGLVSMGMLAFLADGHAPGHGKYGPVVQKALNYVIVNAKPSGLLNINGAGRDMYNHGLSTFVLGQAYGMCDDPRAGPVLDRALRLIVNCQGPDGGWGYEARPASHDLSLAVMQAKALRSAVDSGFDVPPSAINSAIGYVRGKYTPRGGDRNAPEEEQQKYPGQFTYDGNGATLAMAAAGVVCLQEFGQYDDWRIAKSMDVVEEAVRKLADDKDVKQYPFGSPYTLYYVSQSLYQVGGERWKRCYPIIRDRLVLAQRHDRTNESGGWRGDPPVFGTSVACFVLAIPNRYLPILQEGKQDRVKKSAAARKFNVRIARTETTSN